MVSNKGCKVVFCLLILIVLCLLVYFVTDTPSRSDEDCNCNKP